MLTFLKNIVSACSQRIFFNNYCANRTVGPSAIVWLSYAASSQTSFFPEPKGFGLADGWPGRPEAARDSVAGGWRFGGKSAVGDGRRQLAEAIGSVETETKARQAAR